MDVSASRTKIGRISVSMRFQIKTNELKIVTSVTSNNYVNGMPGRLVVLCVGTITPLARRNSLSALQ